MDLVQNQENIAKCNLSTLSRYLRKYFFRSALLNRLLFSCFPGCSYLNLMILFLLKIDCQIYSTNHNRGYLPSAGTGQQSSCNKKGDGSGGRY